VADLERSAKKFMGIDLQWISERGEILESIPDPRKMVAKIVAAATGVKASMCLRFIDPYGDTIFNRAQMAVLREELLTVSEESLDADAREHWKMIVELTKKAESEVHTYLKFYGD
jgi:hypothetical protein